jgi:hypothetical protein
VLGRLPGNERTPAIALTRSAPQLPGPLDSSPEANERRFKRAVIDINAVDPQIKIPLMGLKGQTAIDALCGRNQKRRSKFALVAQFVDSALILRWDSICSDPFFPGPPSWDRT